MDAVECDVDYLAKYLQITCTIEDENQMIIKIKNGGTASVVKSDWSVFLYSMHKLRVSVRHSNTFQIEHVVGSLFKLSPLEEFYVLSPESSLEVILISEHELPNRHFMFPNWYIANETTCAILESTKTLEYVNCTNLVRKQKTGDQCFLERFPQKTENDFKFKHPAQKSLLANYQVKSYQDIITPTPKYADEFYDDAFDFKPKEWFACGKVTQSNTLLELLGIQVKSTDSMNEKCVLFEENESLAAESYEIKVTKHRIFIIYADAAAEYYAINTLCAMICQDKIHCGTVKDSPAFEYRGLHVDVSRNFRTVDEICRIVKAMALYKMNVLHLHLTDDEGWRIQIDGLPELTEIGAIRSHFGNSVEPQLGSGPFANTSGSGYYTSNDYKTILLEARKHHVKVIPEIDMPGHCYAAIKAMKYRCTKYMKQNCPEKALEFLPIYLKESQDIESVQMYDRNTLNPCVDGTWRFIEHVVMQLKMLHNDIQPLATFHVGADEVPDGVWDDLHSCKVAFPETSNMSTDVQTLFIHKAHDICKKHRIAMAIWADGISEPDIFDEEISPEIAVAWRISLKNERYNPYKLANTGQKVVVASATHMYYDHMYDDNFEEKGLNWATKYCDTKKVFDMKPLQMYSCFNKEDQAGHEELKQTINIIGIQAHIWSELIRTEEHFQKMLFPRLIAFAENSWSEAKSENWEKFALKLSKYELPHLESLGINYRLAPPILRLNNFQVECYTEIPGVDILCKNTDSSEWSELIYERNLTTGVAYTMMSKHNNNTSLTTTILL